MNNKDKIGIITTEVANFLTNEKVKVTVKKHANRNEYFKVDNLWVRNFAKKHVKPIDLNNLYEEKDIKELIDNEIRNNKLNLPSIGNEDLSFDKMIIVSDGFNFQEHAEIFNLLPENCCIITTNQALRLWKAIVFPTFYLILNSNEQAMTLLPDKVFPKLISSRRSYHQFLCNYKNIIYFYDPVPDSYYQSFLTKESILLVDDYRNPICAAINLASYFKVSKLYLAFCSHAFKEYRDGTTKIDDGIYQYPQQRLADKIVDANLFWYKASNPNIQIYHTGVKNSFMFARYLPKDLFHKALYI